jgi:hypothetical protein
MIIAAQKLDVILFQNHLAMTITHVLMITVMCQHVNVFLHLLTVMTMTPVQMMNVTLTLVVVIGIFLVMIIMNVLMIPAIHHMVVYILMSLLNVKPVTNVIQTIVILKSDVLMIL